MTEPLPPATDVSEFSVAMVERAQEPKPGATLAELMTVQQQAAEADRELSSTARERQQVFIRESEELGPLLADQTSLLHRRLEDSISVFDRAIPQQRDLLHIFSADTTGSHGPEFYRETWGLVDGGVRVGADARPDATKGTFSASQYETGNNQGYAYAGVGVRFVPRLHFSTLSVRPYVEWAGYDILRHRRYDPNVQTHAWAAASGAIGVHVQSRPIAGGPVHDDMHRWIPMWDRSELDPNTNRDYDGTENLQTIGLEGVFATDERETLVWVSCYAFALSQSVFNVDTRASSSISCRMPLLVVEEIPL